MPHSTVRVHGATLLTATAAGDLPGRQDRGCTEAARWAPGRTAAAWLGDATTRPLAAWGGSASCGTHRAPLELAASSGSRALSALPSPKSLAVRGRGQARARLGLFAFARFCDCTRLAKLGLQNALQHWIL